MFGSNNKTWRAECKRLLEENRALNETCDQLSKRCEEHQATVELAGEAMQRKDEELMAFIGKLHQTLGGEHEPSCEAELLDELRRLRSYADKYRTIRDVLAGRFDPNEEFLRRVACSVGTSQLDLDSVVERAGQLSQVNVQNAMLRRDLDNANQRIADMQEELDESELR